LKLHSCRMDRRVSIFYSPLVRFGELKRSESIRNTEAVSILFAALIERQFAEEVVRVRGLLMAVTMGLLGGVGVVGSWVCLGELGGYLRSRGTGFGRPFFT
ncbi:hypothetical protein, partial [Neisseria sp. P0019.S003]|uniref:hypothetical protein n=1 Tax=Neisseria sp. P0019.S003 TaxID=3436799 RepID=UPI003F7F9587